MRKKRSLTPIEEWAQFRRVGDIPGLMSRSVIKLKPDEGYLSLIDGFKIAIGQSPSEAKRKTKRILERLIKTPGTSKTIENVLNMVEVQKAAVTATQSLKTVLWPVAPLRRMARRSSNR